MSEQTPDFTVTTNTWKNFITVHEPDEKEIAKLSYPSMFAKRAIYEIHRPQASFEIKGVNFWGTQLQIKNLNEASRVIGTVKRNNLMSRTFVIILGGEGEDKTGFYLRPKTGLKSRYLVYDRKDQLVLEYCSRFNWRKFRMEYDLFWHQEGTNQGSRLFLIGIGLHVIKLIQQSNQSAAGAGG